MTLIETLLAQPLVEPIGWTLLHFLWQGAALAIILWTAFGLLGRASANARYLAGCLALATMAACPAITFCRAIQPPPASATIQQQNRTVTSPLPDPPRVVWEVAGDVAGPDGEEESFAPHLTAKTGSGELRLSPPMERRFFAMLQPALPAFVAVWLFGVAVLSVRLLGGWLWLQRMRRRETRPASLAMQEAIARLARRLAVTRPVRILESACVQVPAVIGWLRPTILLPASAATGLTCEQLEAILAHELAHIRRDDYLVNLFQAVIETLLFYHPAVWWVSHRIRVEREHCCDDMAVEFCRSRLVFSKALTALEETRPAPPRLAVASRP